MGSLFIEESIFAHAQLEATTRWMTGLVFKMVGRRATGILGRMERLSVAFLLEEQQYSRER